MDTSFLLLIFPGRSLTIHLGRYLGRQGLSLRGACHNFDDANQLDRAINELLPNQLTDAWIDARHLRDLSWQGFCALLQAHKRAQAAGLRLHWCGLPAWMRANLTRPAQTAGLDLLPAEAYEGPAFLVPGTKRALA